MPRHEVQLLAEVVNLVRACHLKGDIVPRHDLPHRCQLSCQVPQPKEHKT